MILQVDDDLSELITGSDILKAKCDRKVIYYRKADRDDEPIAFVDSESTQLVNARTAYVVLPSGAKYIGGLQGSCRSGHGIMYSVEGEIRFKGEWKNDKFHGDGSYSWINGDKYEGSWKNNLKDGYGTYTFANGAKYVGEWKKDLKDGYGTEYYSDGGIKFKGEWKDDKRHGHGVMTCSDGEQYIGSWLYDKKDGYGKMTLPNGSRYEGMWSENRMHGTGTFTWPDDVSFSGKWDMGYIDGGVLYRECMGLAPKIVEPDGFVLYFTNSPCYYGFTEEDIRRFESNTHESFVRNADVTKQYVEGMSFNDEAMRY